MKKLIALILACTLLLSLAACGGAESTDSASPDKTGQSTTETPTPDASESEVTDAVPEESNPTDSGEPRSLRIGTTAEGAGNMCPYSGNFSYSAMVNVYDGLMLRNADGSLSPYLCKEYYWADTTHLVFELRDDVYFASGSKMTGNDVLFSIRQLNDEPSSGMQTYFGVIDYDQSTVSDDGLTVTLAFKSEYGPFTSKLDQIRIVEKAVVESWDITDSRWWDQPSGSGPYELVENVDGSHATFRLRDDYWNPDLALYWDEVVLEYYTDQTVMGVAFQNGELDIISGLSSSDAVRIENGEVEQGALIKAGVSQNFVLCFDPYTEELQDLNVRKALTHAIDFAAVATVAFGSLWQPADSELASDNNYYISVGQYEYDVDYAKECLAASAYPDGFTLDAVIINSTEKMNIYEAIQSYWAAIGVTLNFQGYNVPVALPMVEQEGTSALFDMGLNGANSSHEPHNAVSAFYDEGTFAPCRVLDEEYNAWYDKSVYSNDPAVRAEAYEWMQHWWHDNYQCIPLFEPMVAFGYRTDKIAAATSFPEGNNRMHFDLIIPADLA